MRSQGEGAIVNVMTATSLTVIEAHFVALPAHPVVMNGLQVLLITVRVVILVLAALPRKALPIIGAVHPVPIGGHSSMITQRATTSVGLNRRLRSGWKNEVGVGSGRGQQAQTIINHIVGRMLPCLQPIQMTH